jgi:hypothetical protein
VTTHDQPWDSWTAVLRRRPVCMAEGRPSGGYTNVFEIICCDCGDHPYWDDREVSPELQRIRGPYSMAEGVAAAATVPGTDPDRASYQVAVQAAQVMVTQAHNVLTGAADVAGTIDRAVLAALHPPRQPRVCARRVKSPLSRWNKHPPGKPRTCQRITKITTEVHKEHPQMTTRRTHRVTTASGP